MFDEPILINESDYSTIETSPDVAELVQNTDPESGNTVAENDPGHSPASVESIVESLGGPVAAEHLAALLSEDAEPVETLSKILPHESIESLVWTALDNPQTQAVVLEDPQVREAIAQHLFNGYSIEDVQRALDYYGVIDDPYVLEDFAEHDAQQKEYREACLMAEEDVRRTVFLNTGIEVAERFGLPSPEVDQTVSDACELTFNRFVKNNERDLTRLVEMYVTEGPTPRADLLSARLTNKFTASLIKQLERMPKAAALDKRQRTTPATNKRTEPTGSYDLNSNDWLASFVVDFKRERESRGL